MGRRHVVRKKGIDLAQPKFERLRIAGWRQFASVDIQFHPRLTVITGANGAGKSTLLNLLSSHLGVSRPYLGVPSKKAGTVQFLSGVFSMPSKLISWFVRSKNEPQATIGEILYTNGMKSAITVPRIGGLTYSPQLTNQQGVLGFHMPSHRLMPTYQRVPSLDFEGIPPSQAFQRLINETYAGYMGSHTGGSVLYQLKNIIASWAALGAGNEYLDKDPEKLKAYRGFVDVLKKVLPEELGFFDIKIQPPDIILRTKSGSFLIDAASGGILTIIEVAALIYACSLREDVKGRAFVVTFDEPENHLHPALQRTLLPTLIEAFPDVQFIVATHSPFMVSSMRDSLVYVLRYQDIQVEEPDTKWVAPETTRVDSTALDYVNRAGSAGEILRQVLGVPVTHPEWVEGELNRLVAKYEHAPLSSETIESLRVDVEKAGLSEFFSDALVRVGERG